MLSVQDNRSDNVNFQRYHEIWKMKQQQGLDLTYDEMSKLVEWTDSGDYIKQWMFRNREKYEELHQALIDQYDIFNDDLVITVDVKLDNLKVTKDDVGLYEGSITEFIAMVESYSKSMNDNVNLERLSYLMSDVDTYLRNLQFHPDIPYSDMILRRLGVTGHGRDKSIVEAIFESIKILTRRDLV